MRTPVCEMLDIEFPILAFSHCRDVVAAVSNAGGLGVLGTTIHSPERADIDLAWIRDHVRGRPFGVDILVPAPYEAKDDGASTATDLTGRIPQAHHDFVERLLNRYDVGPLPENGSKPGPARHRSLGSHQQARSIMDVAFGYDIKLVANALGPPPADMVEEAHRRGVVVAALAGRATHAVGHVRSGVDLIVAQGTEAGGHTGDIATMVLVPEVVDAVAPVPVLAAGGIGGGRQMAAALALGAQGVWCGSVWLTTEEAETHPTIKQKFLAATSADTVRSRSRTGKPARQLRSAWTDAWDAPDAPGTLPMPLQAILVDTAFRRIDRAAQNPDSGGAELSTYPVGQIVGTLNTVRPAGRVVIEMVEECIDSAQRLAAMLGGD